MNTHEISEDENEELTEELQELALLHPSYSVLELKEARAKLYGYFDLAWQIFTHLEREGKLDALNLTGKPVNLKLNSKGANPPANPTQQP
jgi:hypothetical protein